VAHGEGHGGGANEGAIFNNFNDASVTGVDASQSQAYFWKFIALTDVSNVVILDPNVGTIADRFRIVDDTVDTGVFGHGNPFTRPDHQFGKGAFEVLAGDFGAGAGLYIHYSAVLQASSPAPTNAVPELDSNASQVLNNTTEDNQPPVGAVGTLVSALIDTSGPLSNVSDADTGALTGIAVTAASADGTWYYSTNNGNVWLLLGAVSNASARLLAADVVTRLYFRPNANFSGSIATAITFRAWDRTMGANGGTADTSISGGASAFSNAFDTAFLIVTNRRAIVIVGDFDGVAGQDTASILDGQVTMILPRSTSILNFKIPAFNQVSKIELDGLAGDELLFTNLLSINGFAQPAKATIITGRTNSIRTYDVGKVTACALIETNGLLGSEILFRHADDENILLTPATESMVIIHGTPVTVPIGGGAS
jgi:hypothetical protein